MNAAPTTLTTYHNKETLTVTTRLARRNKIPSLLPPEWQEEGDGTNALSGGDRESLALSLLLGRQRGKMVRRLIN
jgi:hypothetical protein